MLRNSANVLEIAAPAREWVKRQQAKIFCGNSYVAELRPSCLGDNFNGLEGSAVPSRRCCCGDVVYGVLRCSEGVLEGWADVGVSAGVLWHAPVWPVDLHRRPTTTPTALLRQVRPRHSVSLHDALAS